jgi:hypothetical protein
MTNLSCLLVEARIATLCFEGLVGMRQPQAGKIRLKGLATNGVVLGSDTAAGARAHGVHAPAEANRGDQLVVGTHDVVRMKVRKKQNPGGTSLPGFSSIRKAQRLPNAIEGDVRWRCSPRWLG